MQYLALFIKVNEFSKDECQIRKSGKSSDKQAGRLVEMVWTLMRRVKK